MNVGEYTFQEFKQKAADFHGYPAPGLLIGGYMVELARRDLPEGTLFEAMVETGKCLPDAVQLLTLCSIGNNWMKIVNLGRYALSIYDKYTGEGFRVSLNLDKMEAYPEIKGWFLKLKPKAEQDTEELFRQIEEAGDTICDIRPMKIRSRYLGHKHMSGIEPCPVCGEAYPVSDGSICRGCQGEAPYIDLDGPRYPAEAPNLKAIKAEDAVGQKVLHDMTGIEPGESKGAEFKAGQELTAGDVCRLQQIGKYHVYSADDVPDDEWVHEDKAVAAFAQRMAGEGISFETEPSEGKINFSASCDGLLTIDLERLEKFNLSPDVMLATRQDNTVVSSGRMVAGTRAIPLYISRSNFSRAMAVLADGPILNVMPLRQCKVGILVTGTEVFQGTIEDKFIPVITDKVQKLGSEILDGIIVPDDREQIAEASKKLLDAGADIIITTAGLSVDPDDVTRAGLVDAGLTDDLYGIPVLPGTMTLLGRMGDARVMGVPACALFFKTTALDLLLPRLLADREITRKDLARLGEGGFCLNCKACTYPKCTFGK